MGLYRGYFHQYGSFDGGGFSTTSEKQACEDEGRDVMGADWLTIVRDRLRNGWVRDNSGLRVGPKPCLRGVWMRAATPKSGEVYSTARRLGSDGP